ncbi:SDR family oxidoreductase [Rhodopirellula sp. JC740]|uniref:SDR family oxidoreductase n=1 Tax=Rhodopirellula halodulae TaxID=2894198 RepID=A0ABS8NCV4_9BACT|nr:SDR family oxidoreductase [Rhodopirellula sp. JC740]MCC9640762.1 SDR family oxidoreductase [Rhodopirellula sp. JC740]
MSTSHPAAASDPSAKRSHSNLLIIGCGYLGIRVGRQALQRGWTVSATTRSRFDSLSHEGFTPVAFDWNDSRTFANLPTADNVLIAVAYDRNSRVERFTSQVDGLARLVRHLDQQATDEPARVTYISTTGVYHQTDGRWVDETSPTHPKREGGRAHLAAEAKLRSLRCGKPTVTLRLAGIYGPDRVPRAADVIAGKPIASPPDGYLNLIHVDDAATAVMNSFQHTPPESLYVVADDDPVIRREFYVEIAKQTRSPLPTFVDPSADSGVRFRSESDKRIWNRRVRRDLLPSLQYPTYREGLHDVLTGV